MESGGNRQGARTGGGDHDRRHFDPLGVEAVNPFALHGAG
jgi:hypothetical protein